MRGFKVSHERTMAAFQIAAVATGMPSASCPLESVLGAHLHVCHLDASLLQLLQTSLQLASLVPNFLPLALQHAPATLTWQL